MDSKKIRESLVFKWVHEMSGQIVWSENLHIKLKYVNSTKNHSLRNRTFKISKYLEAASDFLFIYWRYHGIFDKIKRN